MGGASLPPGFRFHPTDDELVGYYLKRKVEGLEIELEVIPVIDLYKFDPWELPEKSFLPDRDMEWFFFCPRDRKYPNGSRTNRATKAGYWKATGKDRKVVTQSSVVGYRKTLVFYRGRAPSGDRTDWMMHEYRLSDDHCQGSPSFQGGYALCRVVKKNENALKMSEIHGEANSKRIGSSSSNGDFTSMMNSNEQPMTIADDFVSQTTTPHDITPRTGYEPPLMVTDPASIWVSPDLILDSSKEFSQGHQGSGYFQQYEFQNPMTPWKPYNEFSPSSSYSNFTEEIEPANNDFSQIGGMSPYSSGHVNYMGFWGNEDITYQGYDHNNSFGNPNEF